MVIEELFTRLGFQVDPKGIDQAKNKLEGFKKWVGGLAIGAGLTYLAKTGVEAAMQMENLTAQFRVMTGSAEAAKDVLEGIADFAASTPFDKLSLADAGKTLMAFGMKSETLVPTLKMLGDVAGPSAEKLKSLALVFGRVQSAGKLTGGDLMQLINVGFNPLNIIAEQTGMSMTDIKEAMAKGAISADMLTAAFKIATSEGGLFYGNLIAQSQTLAGKISTLKDNFVTALQNMAEAFFPLIKSGVDMLIAFDWTPIVSAVQSVGSAIGTLPEFIENLVEWAQILAPLLLLVFGPRVNAAITLYVAKLKEGIVASKSFGVAQQIVQRAALASGAAMNYQVTTLGLLKSALYQIKIVGVGAFKSLGLAMKAALGPMGIALAAIEGFVAAYNWLKRRTEHEATEKEKEWGRNFFKNKFLYEGKKTPEQVLTELEQNLQKEQDKMTELQKRANLGGAEGRKASEQIKVASKGIKDRQKTLDTLKEVYQEEYGVEWKSTLTPMVKDPNLGAGIDLKKAFADLEKGLKENTKATEGNTKAREKPPFDISALSRQAFDAAFNVKLRELTLGTI